MSLDVEAIRSEFDRLESTNGKILLDHVPTREDIHARWHWKMTELCNRKGLDASRMKIGRYSFLVSGYGKPELIFGESPLEWRFSYDPMPLEWFDHPVGTAIYAEMDPAHVFLNHLAAKHLAGWKNRPRGMDFYRMFVTDDYGKGDKLMMREFLADIHHEMYPQLYRRDALSIWHIARAAHTCKVQRGRLSWWLNMHARKPL